jgi:hypothetical protein
MATNLPLAITATRGHDHDFESVCHLVSLPMQLPRRSTALIRNLGTKFPARRTGGSIRGFVTDEFGHRHTNVISG